MRYFLFIYEWKNSFGEGNVSFGISSTFFPSKEFAKDKALEVCDYEMIKRNDLSIKNIIEFSSEEDYNNYFEK